MTSTRSTALAVLAAGLIAFALPAAAGTLSPQLRSLAEAYQKAPQATVSQARQAVAAHASGIFMPHVSTGGKVQVYMHYRPGNAPSPAALDGLDASGVLVSRALGVVQAWVPIAGLQRVAEFPGVSRVTLPVYAFVKNGNTPVPAADSCSSVPSGLSIDQDGITAERVSALHQQGVKGSGVKVGVISDGADCIAASQAAGYLPGNVWVDSTLTGTGDEGTAMLELVHAMAPDAALGFCGPNTTADFLQCYTDFANWGADIISDDLGFFPVFALSSFDNGIDTFAQNNAAISLVTSAGNSRAGFFQADYVAMTNPSSPNMTSISLSPSYSPANGGAAGRSYNSAMNFGAAMGDPDDAAEKVTLYPGATLYGDLEWDDPQGGPYDDLDLFLLNSDGTVACSPTQDHYCASTFDQTNPGGPNFESGEFVLYTNNTSSTKTLYLVAYCFDCSAHGSSPLLVKLYGNMNGGGQFNYVTKGGIAGHAALSAEFTAAAAHYNGSGVSSTIESFSDTGPFVYGDWQNGTQSRAKPDITGIDGVTISGAGGFSSPFYGTSAASPNVASVIALLRGVFPGVETTAAGWKQLVMNNANANALDNYTADTGGAGLVDATAAVNSIDGTMSATITAPSASTSVNPNTDVAFDANCNYTGSQTLSYLWTFGGNSGIPNSTNLTPAPVQYANGGVYTVKFTCSDQFQSSTARRSVNVQAAATANDQSLSTAYKTPLTGSFTGTGIGGEQVTYEIDRQPAHGTLQAGGGSSSFVYTPNAGFSGSDSFTFDINNGVMASNIATVSVAVSSPPPSGGGGGALGLGALGGLLGLAGLLALRRRRA